MVREIATPTLPNFVTACLQLIKPPASGKPVKVSASFIDTTICALAQLIPLYPTTLRPFNSQVRPIIRAYIAPTSSDSQVVPQSLRENSRRLSILLHHTVAKNGSGDEWNKAIAASIKECHSTADHVFRAVQESWESTTGYRGEVVPFDGEPSGGSDSNDHLPSWTGVLAGSERLIGLLGLLSEYLKAPTKLPVILPVGELLDLTSRITLITPPSPSGEDTVQTNPAIGRDEKAELWSALPDIHTAVLRLHTVLIKRLQSNTLPIAADILDQTVRIFTSSRHLPTVRETAYLLAKELLPLSGAGLAKLSVDSMSPVIVNCCQDILRAVGHLDEKPQQDSPATPATGKNGATKPKESSSSGNADAYLKVASSSGGAAAAAGQSASGTTPLYAAATQLLPLFLSDLPQRHLSPEARGLVDRTAILSANKQAMVASCLHPYKDSRGRYFPSILPFLVRQFPRDQDVEVLRSNLLRAGARHSASPHAAESGSWADPREGLGDLLKEKLVAGEEDAGEGGENVQDAAAAADTKMGEGGDEGDKKEKEEKKSASVWGVSEDSAMEVDSTPAAPNPFAVSSSTTEVSTSRYNLRKETVVLTPPVKRKNDDELEGPQGSAKKVNKKGAGAASKPAVEVAKLPAAKEEGGSDDDDSDNEGSIEIDMTLEDDDEEEDE